MKDTLLLMSVAAAFAFGWFLMGKLDCFLEEIRHAQKLQFSSVENTLLLGFCNPMVADSITDVLDQYSKLCPDICVRIFCGSEQKLLKGLSDGKFDIIFLPENAEVPARMRYHSQMVSLNYAPVVMKYGGLPIEPIAEGHILQRVLWIDETTSAFTGGFMKCLENKFSASVQA